MMRSHGIAPNAATIKPAPSRTAKAERRESNDRPSKKRKADAFIEDNAAADDDEDFTSIKADPTNEKDKSHVKEEEPSQLSLGEAANLMQYYDTPSYNSAQLGGDEAYPGSDYDNNSAGYATPLSGVYGLQAQQSYEFPYTPTGMNTGPGSSQGIHYQPMMHYSTDNQGGSESPVIVE
ncbi:hypothetical protein M430DRAFT_183661 [Amorphotheca resinae ATCC 22711]|jgi:hypothetical protein|uniref:Uncharacterized protein n=1 Tax=Amorphotheca resinae ATCC 22711 TaxID=857342 RepID=A0A2T3AS26_AMORE|nr:hypothetical protein M430DRAFT_183661 [Amorphotheca resinae ATCC 22711]PSS09171.1 hypothetical protein M430DRAFT_183661 [Amorphotheca resinae ATCC 22711]